MIPKKMNWRRTATLLLSLLVCIPSLFAQGTIAVSGRIVDETGQPMIGAGIVQKGTTNGTVSNLDGTYSITVPTGAVLEFSSVGYVTQERVADQPVINVQLALDQLMIEETVVVGYGVQRKSDVTGAISSVKAADIENRTITRAEQALQGKTAGVALITTTAQPGASPTVRVRGFSSNGTSDPLYVVDGLLVDNIGNLDPNNIASIEVLKDAASAAIYGAQAGNGVVLVTTKTGTKGTSSITYELQYSLNDLVRRPKLLNSEQAIQQYLEMDATRTQADVDALIANGVWDGKFSTDWYKESFEVSPTIRHTVGMQGANDRGSFYLALSSLQDNGIIVGNRDFYNRITLMANADYQIKPWLKVGTSNNLGYSKSVGINDGSSNSIYGSMVAAVLNLQPYWAPTYSADKLPVAMQTQLATGYTLLQDEKGDYYMTLGASEYCHPMVAVRRSEQDNRNYSIDGTTYANISPIKGLVFTSRLGYRLMDSDRYSYGNRYYGSTSVNSVRTSVSRNSTTNFYYQWENFVNYTQRFGKHELTGMAGMSYSQNRRTYVNASLSGNDEAPDAVQKDDPLFADLNYANPSATKNLGGYYSLNRKLSYFGRVGYNFANRYIAQASLRADAADSSVLPPTNRWGYFPAVSLGWVLSEEDFYKAFDIPVTYFKLRASWGQNGSTSNLSSYMYSNAIATSTPGYSYSTSTVYQGTAFPSQTYNPNLKWETSEQIDLGFDLRAFNDRLSFGMDWYRKETKDLIVQGVTLPAAAGNDASPINAGNVKNTGLEFELNWRHSIGDFNYSLSGNLATLNNKVTYLTPALAGGRIDGTSAQAAGGSFSAFEVGYPVWYFRGYEVDRIDESGNPVYVDHDGVEGISATDKVMIGKPMPDVTYGLTLNLAWKGLDLNVFGTGQAGSQIFMALGYNTITYQYAELFAQRWTKSNPNGKYARAGYNDDKYRLSNAYVFNGDFFKIKQIQLGYTLPARLTKKVFVERLRLYASLDDWFCFTKYPGLDPEVSASVLGGMGVDYGNYPATRKTVFGLSITF